MFAAVLIMVLMVLVGLGGIVAPILIDAHHWLPRKKKK
jgi:hypothetical protein